MIKNKNRNNNKQNANTIAVNNTTVNRYNLRHPITNRFITRADYDKVIKKGLEKAPGSSFIKSMRVDGNLVHVVLKSNSNIEYVYQPSKKGLEAVKNVLENKGSLGQVFNQYLFNKQRDTEKYRVIYR